MTEHGIKHGLDDDGRPVEFHGQGSIDLRFKLGGAALDMARERKQPIIDVIDYGRLSDLPWGGPVSADKLIEKGLASKEKIDRAVEQLNGYYVDVNREAKTRCIDGRHDPELQEDHLGPQVPGGAPGAALAYRLGVSKDDLTLGTFLNDAEQMMSTFKRLGFNPGGHRDEHNIGAEGTVGCGAIDAMDKVLAAMTNPELVDDHKRIVKMLMGPMFNRDDYLRVVGAGLVLQGRSEAYFSGRERIIDIMEEKFNKSVATLEGEHNECIVVVNMVPNTTLSSNRFSKDFDGMQAFGYDLWRSLEMAEKVLPRSDQQKDRERFVTARIMSTIATLMALTDGSQRLVLRGVPSA